MKNTIYGATTTTPVPVSGGNVDLTEYVKNTDYATTDKAGVVKTGQPNETGLIVKDGKISLTGVTDYVITHPKSYNVALRSCDIYKWFRTGITMNDIELTNEEKGSACEWLGVNALAIPNVISGGEKSLTVDDVSPLAHKCSCRLTSDTYEEIIGDKSNNILELAFGINLENYEGYPYDSITSSYDGKGVLTCDGVLPPYSNLYATFNLNNLIPNKEYTISVRGASNRFSVTAFDADGIPTDAMDATEKFTFQVTDEYPRFFIRALLGNTQQSSEPLYFEDTKIYLQLEEGTEMTEWKPCGNEVETRPYITDFSTVKVIVNSGIVHTPNPDGTIEGIISTSPMMIIETDNLHVNIHDFTYCVDTKAYIDNKFEELKEQLTAE